VTKHLPELGEQAGRTFVVTGANSGIGFESTRALVERGAHVVMAVRRRENGDEAAAKMTGRGTTGVTELDLADLDRVAACASAIIDDVGALASLVCNAGVMGGPLRRSAQGFELQMATNHLGHAALIAGLWPLLEASASRVVLLTSNEGRRGRLPRAMTRGDLVDPTPYDGKQVYRNSKQANLLFAQELHRRCSNASSRVTAVAAHPGAVSTNLFARQLERAGRPRLARISKAVTSLLLPSAAAGSRTTLRALDAATPSGSFVAPSGRTQFRGSPELAEVYPSARDPETAARLWELTEELHGIAAPV
jgi:NAD(P)-dependent dehydrogenase (short-subunit alcohol dehydrogenase family)